MKKVLLGSIILTSFALSIMLFQISCKKDAQAQPSNYTLPPATTTSLGGIIVGNGLSVTSSGTLSVTSIGIGQKNRIIFTKLLDRDLPTERNEIWIANSDGTNQQKINYNMPIGMTGIVGDYDQRVRISPDGQKVFFDLQEISNNKRHIYSCNIDGSNLVKIIDGNAINNGWVTMQAAY
jgi:hypothetical protein